MSSAALSVRFAMAARAGKEESGLERRNWRGRGEEELGQEREGTEGRRAFYTAREAAFQVVLVKEMRKCCWVGGEVQTR